MARKHIGTIISSSILMCCVLLMTSDLNAQTVGIRRKQFQISGSVGVPNVIMKGLPGAVVTDSSGRFVVSVDYGWKGSVTPVLDGYEFTPKVRTISPVRNSIEDLDFQGSIQMFEISGTTSLPNVVLHGFSNSVTSNAQGKFSVQVPYGTTVYVQPELEGYSFTPSSLELTNINRNYPAQRFVAEKKRYSISGMVTSNGMPLSNVLVKCKGNAKDVKTGADGKYVVEVEHGGSVEITPIKEGFEIYPETRSYQDIIADEVTNYEATQLQYTVAGNAGVDNALIRYPGGSVLSGPDGNYSFELTYGINLSIKPEKDGYRFSPPELSHPKLVSNLTSQNFQCEEIVVTISGNTGTSGVLLDGLIDVSGQPVVSNEQGYYEAKVKYNSTLAVMPKKDGFLFQPASRPYSNLKEDKRLETYKAEKMTFEISGNVGLRNVVMKGPQGRFVSNPAGDYTVIVPYDWSGTITPELEGYKFDPPAKTYQNIKENFYSNEDYFTEKKTYEITGIVTTPEGPVEGATISFGGIGGELAETDATGRYTLIVQHGESGVLTCGKEGYTFNNYSVNVPSVVQNREVSFTGKLQMLKISGRLMGPDGKPLPEVRLTADNGGTATVSDSQGRWSLEVPYNWTGQITMENPAYVFDDVLLFSNVIEDQDLSRPQPDPVMPNTSDIFPPEIEPVSDGSDDTDDIPDDFSSLFGQLEAENDGGTTDVEPIESSKPDVSSPEYLAMQEELQKLRRQIVELGNGVNAGQQPGQVKNNLNRGPMVSAQNFSGEEELRYALSYISEDVGIPIIADPDVSAYTTVSFDPMPLEDALELLLAGTNYNWMKMDNYYLVSNMLPVNPSFISGTITQKVKMANLSAETAVSLLSKPMQQFCKAERDGSIVTVTAGPQLIERIIKDLTIFDDTPKQVLLQAKVVVMEEGDLLDMGIEWSWPTVNAGMFSTHFKNQIQSDYDTGGKGIWGVQMGYSLGSTFTNALTLGLNLLKENDKAQMIATPSTMGQDGKLAQMSVITEEYFMLTPDTGDSQFYTQAEMETITSGVKLDITPRISDNNDITMDIAVELSDSIPSGRSSGLPVVTRRTATNTVTVRNGGSAVIAGLNENRRTTKDKKTPGFSNIPLLGKLFNNTYEDKASRDVAIFVTANVIKSGLSSAAPPIAEAPKPSTSIESLSPTMENMNFPATGPVETTASPMPAVPNPAPMYNPTPSANYTTQPNAPVPGTYDSFQAELRDMIARQNRAYNN